MNVIKFQLGALLILLSTYANADIDDEEIDGNQNSVTQAPVLTKRNLLDQVIVEKGVYTNSFVHISNPKDSLKFHKIVNGIQAEDEKWRDSIANSYPVKSQFETSPEFSDRLSEYIKVTNTEYEKFHNEIMASRSASIQKLFAGGLSDWIDGVTVKPLAYDADYNYYSIMVDYGIYGKDNDTINISCSREQGKSLSTHNSIKAKIKQYKAVWMENAMILEVKVKDVGFDDIVFLSNMKLKRTKVRDFPEFEIFSVENDKMHMSEGFIDLYYNNRIFFHEGAEIDMDSIQQASAITFKRLKNGVLLIGWNSTDMCGYRSQGSCENPVFNGDVFLIDDKRNVMTKYALRWMDESSKDGSPVRIGFSDNNEIKFGWKTFKLSFSNGNYGVQLISPKLEQKTFSGMLYSGQSSGGLKWGYRHCDYPTFVEYKDTKGKNNKAEKIPGIEIPMYDLDNDQVQYENGVRATISALLYRDKKGATHYYNAVIVK